MRFLPRSMKTKDMFSRYPCKISLLKDLRNGIYPDLYADSQARPEPLHGNVSTLSLILV